MGRYILFYSSISGWHSMHVVTACKMYNCQHTVNPLMNIKRKNPYTCFVRSIENTTCR